MIILANMNEHFVKLKIQISQETAVTGLLGGRLYNQFIPVSSVCSWELEFISECKSKGIIQQESRAVAMKPRDAAAVLFG